MRLKRAYEAWSQSDGQRILVDGIWPRGLTKAELHLDCWIREIAPSPQLRRWFAHDRAKWDAFKRRYFRELDQRPGPVEDLIRKLGEGPLTLVYAASDVHCNNAVALKEYVERRMEGAARRT
ncbi:MAG: DUF488 family protein [Hyphomicrobiaceae bacterium]|nr:MAG: DUF488 family protein [Hyphomicrobiaceae bacterium]